MRRLITLVLMLSFVSLLGCRTIVTKKNVPDMQVWKLCTLLHRPTEMYPAWKTPKKEKRLLQKELKSKGITSKLQCSIEAITIRKCNGYGFKEGTNEFAGCRQNEEKIIADNIYKVRKKGKINTVVIPMVRPIIM